MSITQQKLSANCKLRNKKKRNRRKDRHQHKIKNFKEQKIIKYNNDLNNNEYDTWKSETLKPIDNPIDQPKNYYNYYKVIEELKQIQLEKLKLFKYIETTYEDINNTQFDDMNEMDDLNKNTCLIC